MATNDFDLIFREAAAPLLFEQLEQELTRWPAGNRDLAETVLGIVDLADQTSQGKYWGQRSSNLVRTNNQEIISLFVVIFVRGDQEIADGDIWFVHEQEYRPIARTTRMRGNQHGMMEITAERVEKRTTSKAPARA